VSKFAKAVAVLSNGYRTMTAREFAGFLRLLLFRNDLILVYGRSLDDPELVQRRPDPRIRKGDLAELVSARRQHSAVPWELKCDLYDGVRDFFVHTDDGVLGHISWLYYRNDPNRILRLDEAECEIKFCLTLPEFRGKGIYPAALQAILQYLRERGYRRCFICVKADNEPSIRGIEKAGFERLGAVRLRKMLGLQVSAPKPTSQLTGAKEGQRWIA